MMIEIVEEFLLELITLQMEISQQAHLLLTACLRELRLSVGGDRPASTSSR